MTIPHETVPAWLLAAEPPVFLTGIPHRDYLGIARSFGQRFGNVDAGFIVFPTWSLEYPHAPEGIRRAFLEHAAEYPRHAFRFICNSERETRLLLAQGLPAELLNQNFTVSETVFQPVSGVEVEFDALYNAQFARYKRHELAALIPRVAYITYVRGSAFIPEFAELFGAAMSRNPRHLLLNQMVDGSPLPLSRAEINSLSSRCAVGLVLSAAEGGNYASMEYMLAGLPVVSTSSVGGRDIYFDKDYCIICEPSPEAVRDAVAELRSRNIPREEVRRRTLAKIEPARRRLLSLIDEVLAEFDAAPRFSGHDWPFKHRSGVGWATHDAHLDEFAAKRDQGLEAG